MDYTARDVRTGIFVLFSLAILFVGVWLAQGRGAAFKEQKTYTVRFRNLGLLKVRTQVAYAGVAAGRIVRLRKIDPGEAEGGWVCEARIAIDPRIEIRAGAKGVIKTEGLIGQKYLDIIPGDGEPLPQGSILYGVEGGLGGVLDEADDLLEALKQTLAQIQVMAEDLGGTTERVTHLLEKIDGLVDENREDLKTTVAEASEAAARLDSILEQNQQGLNEAVKGIRARVDETGPLIEEMGSLVGETRKEVGDLLPALEEMASRMNRLIQEAEGLLASSDPKVLETLDRLRAATRNLEEMTGTLKSDPSVLLWGTSEEERKGGAAVSLPTAEDRTWIGPREEEP